MAKHSGNSRRAANEAFMANMAQTPNVTMLPFTFGLSFPLTQPRLFLSYCLNKLSWSE